MELAYGVGYLLLAAGILALCLPLVALSDWLLGPNPDRDAGIGTVVGAAVVLWLMMA